MKKDPQNKVPLIVGKSRIGPKGTLALIIHFRLRLRTVCQGAWAGVLVEAWVWPALRASRMLRI